MQVHPALVTTLIAERERTLRAHADRARLLPRSRRRTARRAPWPP